VVRGGRVFSFRPRAPHNNKRHSGRCNATKAASWMLLLQVKSAFRAELHKLQPQRQQ